MHKLLNRDAYLPILNGLIGDKLSQFDTKWRISMGFRSQGKDTPITSLSTKTKRKKTVICIHGLMADERVWNVIKEKLQGTTSVLTLRYNTGLHISENGQAFAQLLHKLYQQLDFKELVLIAHSMGGLVVRSACYYGAKKQYPWVKKLSRVFLLAVPNAGSALEKINHATSVVLRTINRFYLGHIGNIMESRSNGIKDLRHGYMLERDWREGATTRSPLPPVPGVRYHILIGSLAKDEKSLLAKFFGDGLVSPDSAVAQTLLKVSEVKRFSNTGHNAILKHPEVIRYLQEKLK